MSKYGFEPLSILLGWGRVGRKVDVLMAASPACGEVADRATAGDEFCFGSVGRLASGLGVLVPRLLACGLWVRLGVPAESFCTRWKAVLSDAGG